MIFHNWEDPICVKYYRGTKCLQCLGNNTQCNAMKDGRMILQNASSSILLFIYVIYYSERYRFSFKKFVILISIPFRVFKTSQKKCSYNSPYVPTFVSHRAKKFVFSIACSLLTTNVQQYLYGPQMRTYIKGYVNIKLKSELFLSQTFNAKSCCNIVLR